MRSCTDVSLLHVHATLLFARSLTYTCFVVVCVDSGVLDIELIVSGEGLVVSCCGVGDPGYGIVVVPDEVDLGVEVWFFTSAGDWSWSGVEVSAAVVGCLSW